MISTIDTLIVQNYRYLPITTSAWLLWIAYVYQAPNINRIKPRLLPHFDVPTTDGSVYSQLPLVGELSTLSEQRQPCTASVLPHLKCVPTRLNNSLITSHSAYNLSASVPYQFSIRFYTPYFIHVNSLFVDSGEGCTACGKIKN